MNSFYCWTLRITDKKVWCVSKTAVNSWIRTFCPKNVLTKCSLSGNELKVYFLNGNRGRFTSHPISLSSRFQILRSVDVLILKIRMEMPLQRQLETNSLSSNNKMIKTIKSIKIELWNSRWCVTLCSAHLSQCYDTKADHGNKNHREMDTVETCPVLERLCVQRAFSFLPFMAKPLNRLFLTFHFCVSISSSTSSSSSSPRF